MNRVSAPAADGVFDPRFVLSQEEDGDSHETAASSIGEGLTLTGDDLQIDGVSGSAKVRFSPMEWGGWEARLLSTWASVRTIEVTDGDAGKVTVNNFVEAEVTLGGDGDSTVSVFGVKRGAVQTGEGDDWIDVAAFSNGGGSSNLFSLLTGGGDDEMTLRGYQTFTQGHVDAGAGNDRIILKNDGDDRVEGGDGGDFISTAGGRDVIDGGAGQDVLTLAGTLGDYDFAADDTTLYIRSRHGSGIDVAHAVTGVETLRFGNGDKSVAALRDEVGITPDASHLLLDLDLSGYTMVFADEFDSFDRLDGGEGTWKTEYYFGGRWLDRNGEEQFYVDEDYAGPSGDPLGIDPFSVEDGVLSIEARPADPAIQDQIDGQNYTSGLITSEAVFAQTYGYFEMRAQLPEGQGLWPAFWLLPTSGEWPPEIDIFEVLGHEPGRIWQGVHGANIPIASHTGIDTSDGFHTYGLEWTEETITWFVDGLQTRQVENFIHEPMYILANLAVGGYWPGSPDEDTEFPAEFLIDYIRAWSKAPPAEAETDPAALSLAHGGTEAFSTLADPGRRMTLDQDDLGRAATVELAVAADGAVDIDLVSAWNSLSTATVTDSDEADVSIDNFVQADVALGDGGNSTISITDAKRGTISTGDGDDDISITARSNGDDWSNRYGNSFLIDSGDGDDLIDVRGSGRYTEFTIDAGAGDDRIVLANGDDHEIDGGDGNDTILAGSGAETFIFRATSGHDRIEGFDPAEDRLTLDAPDRSGLSLAASGEDLLIGVGDASVTLVGGADWALTPEDILLA